MNKLKIFAVVLWVAVSAGGCATTGKYALPPEEVRNFSLKAVCARNDVFVQWDHISQVATLRFRSSEAKVLVGSDMVLMENERVSLSAPVRMVQSLVIVPEDFQVKVIDRLRRQEEDEGKQVTWKIRKIIIDAGHGGKDPGAIGFGGIQEKKIVLDISQRLKNILLSRGFDVVMTRDRDEFISLQNRTEITSREKADLFVSIHANSSPARSARGLEVFTAQNMGYNEQNEEQRKRNQDLMFGHLSIDRKSEEAKKIVSDMLYTYKQDESRQFAERLVSQTAQMTRSKNRGAKDSRFYVVRNTLIPAVLLEVGFLTNPREAGLLDTGRYREQMAQALAESIADYAHWK